MPQKFQNNINIDKEINFNKKIIIKEDQQEYQKDSEPQKQQLISQVVQTHKNQEKSDVIIDKNSEGFDKIIYNSYDKNQNKYKNQEKNRQQYLKICETNNPKKSQQFCNENQIMENFLKNLKFSEIQGDSCFQLDTQNSQILDDKQEQNQVQGQINSEDFDNSQALWQNIELKKQIQNQNESYQKIQNQNESSQTFESQKSTQNSKKLNLIHNNYQHSGLINYFKID